MVERVILVHSDRGHDVDGIRDHTWRLVEELSRHPVSVAELRLRAGEAPGARIGGSLQLWRRLRRLGRSSAIVLQYNPFCYGRRGFAPWLPAYLLAIRAARRRPVLALMVHEPYVPMVCWRSTLMGLWQRFQLSALRLSADVVFASIEPWTQRFATQLPHRPVHHLPVGSNFPDARSRRGEQRGRLGVAEGTLVLSCLGQDHPAWLGEYVVAAANEIARSGRPLALLNLGAQAPPLTGLDPSIALHAPGYLEAEELAAQLAASDLFLAPLVDGVSTRRTTLMAALQHGLPVVGTAGHLTDPILRESGSALRLVEVGDRERFTRTAVELAENAAERASIGSAARLLYERNFDWSITAGRLLAALPER